jgi:hypothetical protein
MPRRPDRRPAKPDRDVDRTSGPTATAAAAPDDEGIDYSDIPDVGEDAAYWTGGHVGPVLATPTSAPAGPVTEGADDEKPVEIQALTELYQSLFRDAPPGTTDADWYLHGFMLGALLGTADAQTARRYLRAVMANVQKRTGVSHAAIETEYREGVADLIRRTPGPQR